MLDTVSHQHEGKPTNHRERTCSYSETCRCGSISMCLHNHFTAVTSQREANSQTASVKTSVDHSPRPLVVPLVIVPLPRMPCRPSCRYHLRRWRERRRRLRRLRRLVGCLRRRRHQRRRRLQGRRRRPRRWRLQRVRQRPPDVKGRVVCLDHGIEAAWSPENRPKVAQLCRRRQQNVGGRSYRAHLRQVVIRHGRKGLTAVHVLVFQTEGDTFGRTLSGPSRCSRLRRRRRRRGRSVPPPRWLIGPSRCGEGLPGGGGWARRDRTACGPGGCGVGVGPRCSLPRGCLTMMPALIMSATAGQACIPIATASPAVITCPLTNRPGMGHGAVQAMDGSDPLAPTAKDVQEGMVRPAWTQVDLT
jgi:hypothetical protein